VCAEVPDHQRIGRTTVVCNRVAINVHTSTTTKSWCRASTKAGVAAEASPSSSQEDQAWFSLISAKLQLARQLDFLVVASGLACYRTCDSRLLYPRCRGRQQRPWRPQFLSCLRHFRKTLVNDDVAATTTKAKMTALNMHEWQGRAIRKSLWRRFLNFPNGDIIVLATSFDIEATRSSFSRELRR
jgi:hypothetical protein